MKCQTLCMVLAFIPLMVNQMNSMLQHESSQPMKHGGDDGPETMAPLLSTTRQEQQKEETSRTGPLRLQPSSNPPIIVRVPEIKEATNTADKNETNKITFDNLYNTSKTNNNGTIKAFSYSLYGKNGLYWKGMINIVKAVPQYFPDWQIWLYHDSTVPQHALDKMRNMYPPSSTSSDFVVKLINVETEFPPEVHGWNPMTWRFLVASDPEVAVYAIRDADALPTERDVRIIHEWLLSNKDFHIIRDHTAHNPFTFAPILGGMWGGRGRSVPHLRQLLQEYYTQKGRRGKYYQYADDQDFLWLYIMPLAYNNVLQHDSYSCRESNGIAFPPLPEERLPTNFTTSSFARMTHQDALVAVNAQNHSRFAFIGNRYAKTKSITTSGGVIGSKPARKLYIQCLQDRQALEETLFQQQQREQRGSSSTDNKMSPAEYFARNVNTTYIGDIQGRSTTVIMKAMNDRHMKQ